MSKVTAVIAAAGTGSRMGAEKNKLLLTIGGTEIIALTLGVFEKADCIDEIILVSSVNDTDEFKRIIRENEFTKITKIVAGGEIRQESIFNGIKAAAGDIIAIHDGARALVTEAETERVIADCLRFGAAAPGVVPKDTLKSVDEEGFVTATVPRDRTRIIQTPQVFRRDIIIKAHEKALADGVTATDDCALAENIGCRIKVSDGSYENIKITTPEDIITATRILEKRRR